MNNKELWAAIMRLEGWVNGMMCEPTCEHTIYPEDLPQRAADIRALIAALEQTTKETDR